MDVSITIPVFNEERLLPTVVPELVADLERRGGSFEVILAENGSTDDTGPLADQLAERCAGVRTLHFAEADYGRALRGGWLASRGDVCVTFSADWIDLPFLDRSRAALTDHDLVLGSKSAETAEDNRPLPRRLGSLAFHYYEQLLFGLPVRDTHGIKAMRRSTMRPVVEACRFGGLVFDTELVVRAHQAGRKMCELPVVVEEKRPPRVAVLPRAVQGIRELAALRLALRREDRRR